MPTASLPQRPRLRPSFYLVPLSKDRMQLRSAHRAVVISGPGTPELITRLFPLLDGTRTTDEIAAACNGSDPRTVEAALHMLSDRALLEDATHDGHGLSTEEQTRFADQLVLFGLFTRDANGCQSALREKRVTIIDLGPLGAAAAQQLARSGVGDLTLVPLSDEQYAAAPVEACRSANPTAKVRTSRRPVALDDPDALLATCFERDLILVTHNEARRSIAHAVNELAIEHSLSWLPISVFGNEVGIGPLIVPGQTACLTCYEARTYGNMVFADEFMAFQEQLATAGVPERRQGALGPYADIVAGFAAIEAIKYLTRFTYPVAFGRLVRFNFINYQFSIHPILRLPRCSSCGVKRPVFKEWDQ